MSVQLVRHSPSKHQFNDRAEPFVRIRPFCDVPLQRLFMVRTLAATVFERQVPGDIVDCQCGNGGISALLGHTAMTRGGGRHTWMLDTFEPRMNAPSAGRDGVACSIDCCRMAMQAVGVADQDFTLLPGCYDRTFTFCEVERIGVLRIGMAEAAIVRACLDRFFGRVQAGGLVLLERYGASAECREAVDRFFLDHNRDARIEQIDDSAYRLFKSRVPYYEPV
ncbi:MAG: TylF/MycF family methyltransferase [Phycisphaerae bacterium]|nr:TylF/MycF family methyltransferase [Phycisphaerae bacterium]